MDQVKKRQVKKVLGWIAMVVVVGLLAAFPLLARSGAETEDSAVSILSGTVQVGTIETVLRGGGTLAEQKAVEVTIPMGIKLEAFLVRNGDAVSAGDALAEVDPVSVMNAIVQVQEKLDELKRELADAADEEATGNVNAKAGGRVKAIYAKAGESVRDVMLRDGALAVLSLDGRMAVKLRCNARFSVGETVSVTLADGSTVNGRVESNLDGALVVSIEDTGFTIGESVSVFAGGAELGTGELYVHNAWNAVAWSGIIEAVNVGLEDTVGAGDVLFELKDVESTAGFQALVEEHREYEQIMRELVLLYESGIVTASCDGVVSGVDEKSSLLLENDSTLTDFSRETATILTVVPQDTMTLTITVDEQDIGRIYLGQTAQVKVDALKNQTFEAVVTAISTRGTNNGGSSKFAVSLTMDRGVNMLPGMSASAGITLETAADVLTIPLAALCEQGSRTLVYTGYDPQTGELTDPITVTTGISDGITVQILAGLETGDTFYYPYYEAPLIA